ncbi:hypothetical protein TNCV_4524441 [Trichonephila clavipes]|nr:hypothetical protein TNCV_4524441 [Trichonephila clavipes]
MIVQFRNEKVSNHGSIPITIDCNVVAFIVFEEGFHQPIKRTKHVRDGEWTAPGVCKSLGNPKRVRRKKKRRNKIGKTRDGCFRKAEKEDLGVLDRDSDEESWTRMRIRKNALRTVPRQAVERATSKRGYHTGYAQRQLHV